MRRGGDEKREGGSDERGGAEHLGSQLVSVSRPADFHAIRGASKKWSIFRMFDLVSTVNMP